MLSPSHPGPYKATHLAMRDRTVWTGLVATAAAPVFISNSVGVKRRSAATDYRAKDCALLTTNRCANYRARACSDTGGKFVAMPIPE